MLIWAFITGKLGSESKFYALNILSSETYSWHQLNGRVNNAPRGTADEVCFIFRHIGDQNCMFLAKNWQCSPSRVSVDGMHRILETLLLWWEEHYHTSAPDCKSTNARIQLCSCCQLNTSYRLLTPHVVVCMSAIVTWETVSYTHHLISVPQMTFVSFHSFLYPGLLSLFY